MNVATETRVEKVEEYIIGKHVYGNLYGIPRELAIDEKYLIETVVKAAELANMTLVDVKSYSFGGLKGGVSVIALIMESHIAIHTWVEYRYATVDVYTCGDKSDPWKAFQYIVERLKPKDYTINYADRTQHIKSA
uniref:Arginine decarboxylase proenzyme n=1 Tax=Staphylothermus marinus TaxID=2280 RepID=A0A7C4HDJ9_STAMA